MRLPLFIATLVFAVHAGIDVDAQNFIRADVTADGTADITDVIHGLRFLIFGNPSVDCLDAGDVDDNGVLDISDSISFLMFEFLGAAPPRAPYPECGPDPSSDTLGCSAFAACENSPTTGPTLADFGPESDTLHFDNLRAGAELDFQLMVMGVRMRSLDGSRLGVVDEADLSGINAPSAPLVVDSGMSPFEIRFSVPRRRVGMFVGIPGASSSHEVLLVASDDNDVPVAENRVTLSAFSAAQFNAFVGVETDGLLISRVNVTVSGPPARVVLDDLMVDPFPEVVPGVSETIAQATSTLSGRPSNHNEKLEAIAQILAEPSHYALIVLQDTAANHEDDEIRRAAVNGLTQLRDPSVIETLADIAMTTTNKGLAKEARNAAWSLRQDFPIPGPPTVTILALDAIRPGQPFSVQARIVSPVDREHVQVQLGSAKRLTRTAGGDDLGYEGPLAAGEELVIQANYVADSSGQTVVPVTVRINENGVDGETYTRFLYLEASDSGGSASTTPPQETSDVVVHTVDLGEPSGKQLDRSRFKASPGGERNALIRGQLFFQDGDSQTAAALPAASLPSVTVTATKPARFVKVSVVDATDPGEVFGTSSTNEDGVFGVQVEDVSNGAALRLLLEIDNAFCKIYVDRDLGDEELRMLLPTFGFGSSGAIVDLAPFTIGAGFVTVTVDENGILPGGSATLTISPAGALNINDVIQQSFDYAAANRDSREGDTVGRVNVEYCEQGISAYGGTLMLQCARFNGSLTSSGGLDSGFNDWIIVHEYGHHLEHEISTSNDGTPHTFCGEIDTTLQNDPEIAWSEGFADYLATHLVTNLPGMSTVGMFAAEHACRNGSNGSTAAFVSTEDERFISVEGHVAAVLWDLTDGLGSGNDAWDMVDGPAVDGGRTVFQIFDRELDRWGGFLADAPDIRNFYEAWTNRFGPLIDYRVGVEVLDPIFNRNDLVPGGRRVGEDRKNRPHPVVEPNPVLPGASAAALDRPAGTIPQYRAPVYTPPDTTQSSPEEHLVLTVTRDWSYLDQEPREPQTPGVFDGRNRVAIQIGMSNLGSMTMKVDDSGSQYESDTANYTVSTAFTPSISNWLSVGPTRGSFASSAAPELHQLTAFFLPPAFDLNQGRYEALISIEFNGAAGQSDPRLIRIVLNVLEGPDDDADGDGLTNAEEQSRTCLDPCDSDSDNDGLGDGDEENVHGTNPCRVDSDGDGFGDGQEVRSGCMDPTTADAHLDGDKDGLSNQQEVDGYTDPCDDDTDDDGYLDGADNCPLRPNNQDDFDNDGLGDVCDWDADGDGCNKIFDFDDLDPTKWCVTRPLDPAYDRRGRVVRGYDPRLGDPRLRAMIDSLLPGGICGELDCPPPGVRVFDETMSEVILDIRGVDHGLDKDSGFADSVLFVRDSDGDELGDLLIAAPRANDGQGLLVLVSSRTGEELGRVDGPLGVRGFGAALTSLRDSIAVVGAPGDAVTPGGVFVLELDGLKISASVSPKQSGDRFGSALAAFDDEGKVVIGAPGANGRGEVYRWDGKGELDPIASGTLVGSEFGSVLVAARDLRGDGHSSVLVGSPGRGDPGDDALKDAKGIPSQLSSNGSISLVTLDGDVLWTIQGQVGEELGTAATRIDVDTVTGGATYFWVGAPGWNGRRGRACLFDRNGQMVYSALGEKEGAKLGRHVGVGPSDSGIPLLVATEPNVGGDGEAMGRSTFYKWEPIDLPNFVGPLPYLSDAQSPFVAGLANGTVRLEDFEANPAEIPGVQMSSGSVLEPSTDTNSVDGDDGEIDGAGKGGHSWFTAEGDRGLVIEFDAEKLGQLPTRVGVTVTQASDSLVVEAFDARGVLIDDQLFADHMSAPGTGDDRFFGVTHDGGISAIRIASRGDLQVDHLQYGW
jgi:hypothetical protein